MRYKDILSLRNYCLNLSLIHWIMAKHLILFKVGNTFLVFLHTDPNLELVFCKDCLLYVVISLLGSPKAFNSK